MACVFEQHMPQHACKSKLLVVCISSSMTSFFYCNNLIFYPEGSNLIRYLDLILDMQLHEEIFLLLFITNLFCSNKIISNKNTSDLKKNLVSLYFYLFFGWEYHQGEIHEVFWMYWRFRLSMVPSLLYILYYIYEFAIILSVWRTRQWAIKLTKWDRKGAKQQHERRWILCSCRRS